MVEEVEPADVLEEFVKTQYCNAINVMKDLPSTEFSGECLICSGKHSFDECPTLKNSEFLMPLGSGPESVIPLYHALKAVFASAVATISKLQLQENSNSRHASSSTNNRSNKP